MTHSRSQFRFSFLSLLLLMLLVVVSCDTIEDASIEEIENLSDESIEDLQSKIVGKKHCVEFVFPISITFIDSSTIEVSDYEDLYEQITTFFEENELEKSKENRPTLVFPLEVLNEEGEVIQVNSRQELKALKSECPREGKGKKGKKGSGHHCLELVFPISVIIDGETSTFEDRESLKEAIKAYKEAAGEEAERPELVFPLSIMYEDGSTVEVDSKETLKELKEACKEE